MPSFAQKVSWAFLFASAAPSASSRVKSGRAHDRCRRLVSASGDGEFHGNLGLRVDRLSRLLVRLKAPLLNGFTRGIKKSLGTTDHLKVLDVPVSVDLRQQHHPPIHHYFFRQ